MVVKKYEKSSILLMEWWIFFYNETIIKNFPNWHTDREVKGKVTAVGYYDDENRQERSQKRRGSFLPGLIGAIIGAVIMLIAVPKLVDMGLFSNEQQEAVEDNGDNTNGTKSNVTVDVQSDITKAVSHVSNAVVGVINLQQTNFWDNQEREAGAGSGVIYKKAGGSAFIVTNNHVVEGASDLEVTLSSEERIPAKLVGTDPLMDLAVLEIDSSKVKEVAEFGSSADLKLGEPAIAIGNPLGFLEGTVTAGIISNIERTIPVDLDGDKQPDWNAEVIQTDASINPGNSGGALINIAGQVIGINSSKIAQEAVEGIGFAIPIDIAKPIIDDLEKYGEVKRPFLGAQLQDLTEIPNYHVKETLKLPSDIEEGVVVMGVVPNSSAKRAGLKELDVITQIDGNDIKNVLELRKFLYNEKKIGDSVKITFYRDGKKNEMDIKLTEQQTY